MGFVFIGRSISDTVAQGVIADLVQLFFAWRVKVLTSNRVIVALVVVLAIIQLCMLVTCR